MQAGAARGLPRADIFFIILQNADCASLIDINPRHGALPVRTQASKRASSSRSHWR